MSTGDPRPSAKIATGTSDRDGATGLNAEAESGREIRELFAPVSARTFLEEYWQVKPLYIPGYPEKFRDLFSRHRFEDAIQRATEKPNGVGFKLGALVKDEENHGGLTFTEAISPVDVDRSLAAGQTICVTDIGVGDDRLGDYARKIKEQLQYTGKVHFNCYFSPHGSGADTHFDARASTTLQIEGKKRWRFSSRPAVTWPLSNAQLRPDGSVYYMLPWAGGESWEDTGVVDESEFVEVVLEPGDLLFLPAGTWHNARAIGSSLALNLAFGPADFFTFLLKLLEAVFVPSPAWRGGVPPVPTGDPGRSGLPPEMGRFIQGRIDDVMSFLQTLDLDGDLVRRTWMDIVDSP